MSWFSFLRKNKLEPAPDESEFYSHAENIPLKSRGRAKNKETPVDPVLPEKKRARRRLVGAVTLTLVLVITLPMFLDAEPTTRSEEITIQIPSRDKLSKLSAGRPVAPVVSASTPGTAADKTDTSRAKDEAKPTPAKPIQQAAKPAKPEPKQAAQPATPISGKFVVQIAALASEEKVDELRAKLNKAGLKSHTQKVATKNGERIRVRLGPFSSKDEAEKLCPKLSKMNLKCTVLTN